MSGKQPTLSTDWHDRKPIICACGDHAFVAITRGLTTMVSPEDAAMLDRRWYAQEYRPGKLRVRRDFRRPGSGTRKLTRENLAALIVSAPDGLLPDHISGDALDNRRRNLRAATGSQNQANRYLSDKNTSGFKGVHYLRRSGLWRAVIGVDSRKVRLGEFTTAEAAAAAYDAAAERYFGEFARTNSMILARAA